MVAQVLSFPACNHDLSFAFSWVPGGFSKEPWALLIATLKAYKFEHACGYCHFTHAKTSTLQQVAAGHDAKFEHMTCVKFAHIAAMRINLWRMLKQSVVLYSFHGNIISILEKKKICFFQELRSLMHGLMG